METIDRNLNITLDFNVGDVRFCTVTKPISRAMFDANFRLFRAVYDDIASGDAVLASVALSRLILLDVGERMGKKDQAQEFLNTIESTTLVTSGGAPALLADANINEDVREEIACKLIFFMLYSRHVQASNAKDLLKVSKSMLKIGFTDLSPTDYLKSCFPTTGSKSSLTTLTTTEPTTSTIPS